MSFRRRFLVLTIIPLTTLAIAMAPVSAVPTPRAITYTGVLVMGGPDLQPGQRAPQWLAQAAASGDNVDFSTGRAKLLPIDSPMPVASDGATPSDAAPSAAAATAGAGDSPQAMSPMTSPTTESGYKLPVGGTTSDNCGWNQTQPGHFVAYGSNGVIAAEVDVSFKQRLQCGTSDWWVNSWTLTYRFGEPYEQSYWYRCALNISGADDHYCDGYVYPNNTTDSAWGARGGTNHYLCACNGQGVANAYFGQHFNPPPKGNTQVIKFPMIKLTTDWPGLPSPTGGDARSVGKFRLYDVCIATARFWAQMCHTSGTGS